MKVIQKKPKNASDHKFINLLGGKKMISQPVDSEFDLIALSNHGITKASLEILINYIGISKKAFSENILDASVKTLERKKDTDMLDKHTSSLAIEIAKVVEHALAVFEDESKVKSWLIMPNSALNQARPVDFFHLPTGLKLVNDILGRIEYGIFS